MNEALDWITTNLNKEVLNIHPESDLVLLYRGIPNVEDNGNNKWWTPSSISALTKSGPEGKLLFLVIPNVILNSLISSQVIEAILEPDHDEDHENFFPQYYFREQPRSYLDIPQIFIQKIRDQYYSEISTQRDPYSALPISIRLSKEVGREILSKLFSTPEST